MFYMCQYDIRNYSNEKLCFDNALNVRINRTTYFITITPITGCLKLINVNVNINIKKVHINIKLILVIIFVSADIAIKSKEDVDNPAFRTRYCFFFVFTNEFYLC